MVPKKTTRPPLARWVWLALLAAPTGCMSNCYYDGPRRGSDFVAVAAETPTGDASYTRTPFSFAIRYHGFEVDGAPRTGFVSALGAQAAEVDGFDWGSEGTWPLLGRVVALQGWFAEQHPDWLCQEIELGLAVAPGSGGAAWSACPNLQPGVSPPDCGAPAFTVVTTNVHEYADIFNQEVPEPDLFVTSTECEVPDAP